MPAAATPVPRAASREVRSLTPAGVLRPGELARARIIGASGVSRGVCVTEDTGAATHGR
jgi:hypothetical protein